MKDPEHEAIGKVIEALDGLDAELQDRVIRWAADRYGVTLGAKPRLSGSTGDGGGAGGGIPSDYEDVGDLVAAAAPSTDEDRALVIAYWLQELREEKQPTFTGQQVNTELKNLGHGTDNITAVIGRLVATSPQQMLQTKKTGSNRQGRKTFKVTKAGKRRVQELLDGSS
jgi:hypothetical protein